MGQKEAQHGDKAPNPGGGKGGKNHRKGVKNAGEVFLFQRFTRKGSHAENSV